jgi:hypothetical protein
MRGGAQDTPISIKMECEDPHISSLSAGNEGFRSIVNQKFPTDANKEAKI